MPQARLRGVGRRLALIVQFEPSWFAECVSAIGILLWSVFAILTDNYGVRGWSLAMPVAGLLVGPSRLFLLFRLDAAPRVAMAAVGFVWWGWICFTLYDRLGIVPAHGALMALALGDLLTVLKFSLSASHQAMRPTSRVLPKAGKTDNLGSTDAA